MSDEISVLLVEPNIEYRGNTGGSVHLTEVSRELGDLVDLKVVCECGEDFEEDGVEFYHVDSGRFSLLSLPKIWRLSREADLVHSRADPFEIAGPLTARLRGIPVVGEVNVNFLAYEKKHSLRDVLYPLFHAVKYLWLKVFVKGYDRVVTVSDSISEELVEIGFKPEKLDTVRNGGDPERFTGIEQSEAREELGLPEDGYVVLLMGELGPRHGLDRLVGLDMEDATFLVLGGSEKYREFIEEQKEEASDNFVFHDPVPYEEVPNFVAASDVVVAPYDESDNSHEFGFCPIKILDGMAAGKPVVASDRPWIREILSEDEGIVTDDIMEALEELRDEDLRKEKGENARKKVEEGLSWKHTAENLFNVYSELVDRHGR